MTTKKHKKPTITDSTIFKSMNKKGTCAIDAGRADRKLNIPDEIKIDKEFLFLNSFTEPHLEDFKDIINIDITRMSAERANS